MSELNYRLLVHYDAESENWRVTIPEMPGLTVVGATRAEAVTTAEEELERHIDQLNMSGLAVPPPVDEEDWGTELSVELSASLHKELAFQAKWEKVELPALVVQILSEGLTARRIGRRPEGKPRRERPRDRDDQHREHRGRRGGRRGGSGAGYQKVMYDGASFREYVRSIEPEGGKGRRPRKRRGGGDKDGNR